VGIDLSAEEIESRVNHIELANIEVYGDGVSSFALSLIETAIGLTDGRITGADLRDRALPPRALLRSDGARARPRRRRQTRR
jgi:putative hydrolase of the HAD superfamily